MKKALFSVDNLSDVVRFATELKKMGWHIIATKETVKELKSHDIAVEDVAEFVGFSEDCGFPPTMHPKMEAALTMDVPYRIDLVYDIPYPLSKGNDVGGRTLLGMGAKGNRIVVFTMEDIEQVIERLRQDPNHTVILDSYKMELIDKAYAHIAGHYITLACHSGKGNYHGLLGTSVLRLANGENPCQVPADLFMSEINGTLSLHQLQHQNVNAPCFTNLADTDCILHTLCLTAEAFRLRYKKIPYIAIAAKHGNSCGMAIDWDSAANSISGALFGNPLAIWGGEFIANFKIDREMARLLYESQARKEMFGNAYWMLDVIAVPDFDEDSLEILGKNSSRKLFKNKALYEPKLPGFAWHCRQVRGGFLRQPSPNYILDTTKVEGDTAQFKGKVLDSLIIAWSVAYSSNHGGNEVALAKESQLIGVGGGPSTVDAAKTAVLRAQANGHDTRGSIFAANAFFPFTDAPKVLKEAGCSGGVVPAGGKNEAIVKRYFRDNGIEMVCLPSQYRGFSRH